jgi:hypothetical protein
LEALSKKIEGDFVEEQTMGKKLVPPANPEPITSPKIKRLAGIGLATPSKLSPKQVQELAASVEAHIEPRKHSK